MSDVPKEAGVPDSEGWWWYRYTDGDIVPALVQRITGRLYKADYKPIPVEGCPGKWLGRCRYNGDALLRQHLTSYIAKLRSYAVPLDADPVDAAIAAHERAVADELERLLKGSE